MSDWSIADAKARFSELVLRVSEGPQPVYKRGRRVAVVVSADRYEELVGQAGRREPHPMRAFLEVAERLRREGDLDLSLPPRRSHKGRRDPFSP